MLGKLKIVVFLVTLSLLGGCVSNEVKPQELRIKENTYTVNEIESLASEKGSSPTDEIFRLYVDAHKESIKTKPKKKDILDYYSVSEKEWGEIEEDARKTLENNYRNMHNNTSVIFNLLGVTEKDVDKYVAEGKNESVLFTQLIPNIETLNKLDNIENKKDKEEFINSIKNTLKSNTDKIYNEYILAHDHSNEEHNHDHEEEEKEIEKLVTTEYGTIEFGRFIRSHTPKPFEHVQDIKKGEIIVTDDGLIDIVYAYDLAKIEDRQVFKQTILYHIITNEYGNMEGLLYHIQNTDNTFKMGKDIQQLITSEKE